MSNSLCVSFNIIDYHAQWIIERRNGGDILRIGPYVTMSENDGVWSVLTGTASATQWIVRPHGNAFMYVSTLIIPSVDADAMICV